jgi:prevent-host-death family protein
VIKLRFISVRDLRLKPGEVWKLTKQEKDLIITANGRPIAILVGITEETLEDELDAIQRSRALRALDNLQKESSLKGTDQLSSADIDSEIRAVRKRK